ncbi:hypothetical protein Agabi119p4_5794 [Agaricus bisporus var. burnettii]|uniref:Integrase catalytic domain-containing protein n=1 Tax=Agaricus bisporus var. burnettii TaxID=192524 RepID=A0A8H7F2A2_AGABI|nr:hypothetical protein Agabi119p4_5794 [Agaricus bisporus var. burnettii]
MQHKDSTLTAWDVSGSSQPLPTLPTNPDELAKENAIRMTLSLQATALIESTLPDYMIREEFNSPRDLWDKMKLNYGVRGPTFVYERLQALINFKVQDTQDPSGQIAEFVAICSQITATGATLHDSLQTMMLLSALPARMESTIGIILASAANVADLTIEKARAIITAAWRNPQNLAAARFKPSGQAPRWQNATPGTSGQNQQQQQRPHGQQQQKPQGQQQRQQAPQGAKPDDDKKRKRTRGKGKGKGKGKAAAVEASPPDYTAASAIAFPTIAIPPGFEAQPYDPRSPSLSAPTTRSLVHRIRNEKAAITPPTPLIGELSHIKSQSSPDKIFVHSPLHTEIIMLNIHDGNEWIDDWRHDVDYQNSIEPDLDYLESVDPSADGTWLDDGSREQSISVDCDRPFWALYGMPNDNIERTVPSNQSDDVKSITRDSESAARGWTTDNMGDDWNNQWLEPFSRPMDWNVEPAGSSTTSFRDAWDNANRFPIDDTSFEIPSNLSWGELIERGYSIDDINVIPFPVWESPSDDHIPSGELSSNASVKIGSAIDHWLTDINNGYCDMFSDNDELTHSPSSHYSFTWSFDLRHHYDLPFSLDDTIMENELPYGRTYTWIRGRYTDITYMELDIDRIAPTGAQRTRDPRLNVARTGRVTPYQTAKLNALLAWDKRLGARPIDRIALANHNEEAMRPDETPSEYHTVAEEPERRSGSPIDYAIEEFGNSMIEEKEDGEISIHSGQDLMDNEEELDYDAENDGDSYPQVLPPYSQSITNSSFQRDDVDRSDSRVEQTSSLSSSCNGSDINYAMELSVRNALLDNITPEFKSFIMSIRSNSDSYPIKWMLDSGASAHFTGSLSDFSTVDRGFFGMVQTASGQLKIQGRGTVHIQHLVVDTNTGTKEIQRTKLWPVFYINGMHMRLISVGQLLRSGLRLEANAKHLTFRDENNHAVLSGISGHFPSISAVLSRIIQEIPEAGAYATANTDYSTWHRRLGHPSDLVLSKFSKESLGIPPISIPRDKPVCKGCVEGKLAQKPFPTSESRGTQVLELIHSDLFELPVISYHRHKWVLTILDDYSSTAFTVMLAHKSDAPREMTKVMTLLANSTDRKIKRLRTDRGGEYTNSALQEYLSTNGIKHELSAPNVHQQNGRAERLNRTLHEKSQAMRKHACLPDSWWGFSMTYAVYIYNRTPMQRVKWKTPYELFYGTKPDLSKIRVFGCGAYVYLPKEIRKNKLSSRSELMIFLGYQGPNYQFMRHQNGNVIFVSPTALFDETFLPKCDKSKPGNLERRLSNTPSRSNSSESENSRNGGEVDFNLDPNSLNGPSTDQPPINRAPPAAPPRPPTPPQPIVPPRQQRAPSPPPRNATPGPSNQPPRQERPTWRKRRDITPPDESEHNVRRSRRETKVPNRPDNVYGDKHPSKVLRDYERQPFLPDFEEGIQRRVPPRSDRQNARIPTDDQADEARREEIRRHFEQASQRAEEYEQEHGSQLPSQFGNAPVPGEANMDEVQVLIREGGVKLNNFLFELANQIQTPVQFKDLTQLPAAMRKKWIDACLEELEALQKRGVYELVDLPKGRRTIKNRWVFNEKSDGRLRARLVAKGFSQIEGIDYNELFSPVVRYETARLLLGIAALEDWDMFSVDVKTAYLYGKLDEEIYMTQPEGFTATGKGNKVWRLRRALYGLKQAGLSWWKQLTASMTEIGFVRCKSDAGVYYYRHPKTRELVVALVYVDDVAFMGKKNSQLLKELKLKFSTKWECRDQGVMTEFLGMQISRDRQNKKIFLHQQKYLQKVLDRFGIKSGSEETPLPKGYVFKTSDKVPNNGFRTKYQQLVGSLMYLMIGSRPDIAFAVVKLSQHMVTPNKEHYTAGMHLLRYLNGTKNMVLEFDGNSNQGVIAYSDSDWASDPEDRKSITGNFVTIANGTISWLSRKQKTVALSSTEAEYMAISDCSRQLVWVSQLLTEIGFEIQTPMLYGDNMGSLFWSTSEVQEKRSKHIDIRFHYIRELLEQKQINLDWIDGSKNPADVLTKNLEKVKFSLFRSMLNLKQQ